MEIRLNVDVDEATFYWLAGGKGVVSAEDAAKEVLSTWAKEQQELVKQRAMARRLERTPAFSGQVDRRYSTDEVRLKDRTPAMG